MRDRQIADPQAGWTPELGHTEIERGESEREMFLCLGICVCVRGSLTLEGAIIDYFYH